VKGRKTMAKTYDVRLNVYLDSTDPKDKIIVDYLRLKYSEVGFIKETMYELATNQVVQSGPSIQANTSEPLIDQEVAADKEFEPVKGADEIKL
jgi:hypothetical protein